MENLAGVSGNPQTDVWMIVATGFQLGRNCSVVVAWPNQCRVPHHAASGIPSRISNSDPLPVLRWHNVGSIDDTTLQADIPVARSTVMS